MTRAWILLALAACDGELTAEGTHHHYVIDKLFLPTSTGGVIDDVSLDLDRVRLDVRHRERVVREDGRTGHPERGADDDDAGRDPLRERVH